MPEVIGTDGQGEDGYEKKMGGGGGGKPLLAWKMPAVQVQYYSNKWYCLLLSWDSMYLGLLNVTSIPFAGSSQLYLEHFTI